MTSQNRRRTQAVSIKHRAKAPSDHPERCIVFACNRPTQRSAHSGLSEEFCKQHSQRLRSHGHETRKSYSKAELLPYRAAAVEWLRQHRGDIYVVSAISKLESLMSSQGRSKDAYYQRSMRPLDKAKNVLARLHEAGKTGEQLLLIVLAVKAAHSELGPWGAPDWQAVQIAKQAKKLRGASGTVTGLYRLPRKYPRGEGIYMRHLGRMIDEKSSHAIDGHAVEEVKALRRKQ